MMKQSCRSQTTAFCGPYMNVLDAISQLLQNNGYEAACKFLDDTYER